MSLNDPSQAVPTSASAHGRDISQASQELHTVLLGSCDQNFSPRHIFTGDRHKWQERNDVHWAPTVCKLRMVSSHTTLPVPVSFPASDSETRHITQFHNNLSTRRFCLEFFKTFRKISHQNEGPNTNPN